MIRLESHQDYPEYEAAHKKLAEQAQKNQKLIAEKLSKINDSTDSRRKTLDAVNSQNMDIAGRVDTYLQTTEAALSQTMQTLNFVRNGKFQDEVNTYLVQLELVEMRLQAGAEGDVEHFHIYQCRSRWHVSEATSTESIGDFATQKDAEDYAKKLRRRFRILSFLSEN